MRKIESSSFGRLERGLLGLVLSLGAFLWLVGEQATVVSSEAGSVPGLPMGGGGLVAIVLALIILNAFFVASETAVDLLNSLHVKHAPTEAATLRLQELLDKQQRYVAACSIGSQAVRLALIFLSLFLARDLAAYLYANPAVSYERVMLVALGLVLIVMLVNVIVGELVPKSFAALHTGTVSNRLFRFIKLTSFLFSIPAGLVVSLATLVTARFGGTASFTMANQAEEQIKSLVETAQESGEMESDERELLHSVFEFTDTVVREVMTPRVDLESVPVTTEPSAVAKMIEDTGHSRIPLFVDTDDNIVGIIHAKDLLLAMVEGGSVDLRMLMRPPLFVPENMNLHEAMTEMRVHRSQMAIVQDEFGGTAGIVTIEDIVEELVGDIVDEYDVEVPEIVQTEGGFLVEGKTHLDDLNDEIGSNFESEEFDTIGGFVFGLFGRQPKEGEFIDYDGYLFTVVGTDGRRVERLSIVKSPEEVSSEA